MGDLQTFIVHNIKCGGCANSIKSSLLEMEGIEMVDVDVAEGKVAALLKEGLTAERVEKKLASMGYPVEDPSVIQTAKSYVSCMVGRIKKDQ